MCRLWSRSVCLVLVVTGLACRGTVESPGGANTVDAGAAAGSGGTGDAGNKDSAARDAGVYSNSGSGGAGGAGGANSAGGSAASRPDVKPAECLPDPTDFAACGGDVVGSWRIASFCLDSGIDDLRQSFSCPEITQDFNVDYRTLVQFKANGDYSASLSSDVTQNVTIPKTCLGGANEDCSVLGPDDTDPSDDDWTLIVHDSGDNCLMDAEKHILQSAAGSFSIDGNKITITDSSGPATSEYCVDGDKLTVKSVGQVSGEVSWGQYTRL